MTPMINLKSNNFTVVLKSLSPMITLKILYFYRSFKEPVSVLDSSFKVEQEPVMPFNSISTKRMCLHFKPKESL